MALLEVKVTIQLPVTLISPSLAAPPAVTSHLGYELWVALNERFNFECARDGGA